MNKKTLQHVLLGLFYAILIFSFIGLALYTQSTGNKRVLIASSITPVDEVESSESDVVLTFECVKEWAEQTDKDNVGKHYGVQYDMVIYNKQKYDITNWMLTYSLPQSTHVDSSWNSVLEVVQADELVNFTVMAENDAKLDNTIVKGNASISFGLVVHMRFIPDEIENLRLYGIYSYKITDFPLFWILVAISTVTVFLTLVQLFVAFRLHAYQVQKQHDDLFIMQSINTFVNFIDAKDPYTKGHSTRVAVYSRELAKRMNLSAEEQKNIYFVAMMHDVGKISIPDSILQKPGRLDPAERKVIESHTTIGGTMLSDFNALPGIISGALYHHERYDGKGYPQGLSGTDIPLFARIICVADSYDAMSSRRCYRAKLGIDEIVKELKENSGKQFDPVIAKHMIDMLDEAKVTGRLSHYNL